MQTITAETLETITALDLRAAAEEAIASATVVGYHRHQEYNAQVVETVVIDGRAGQASGGDAVWGDWSESTSTLTTDDGIRCSLDGSQVDDAKSRAQIGDDRVWAGMSYSMASQATVACIRDWLTGGGSIEHVALDRTAAELAHELLTDSDGRAWISLSRREDGEPISDATAVLRCDEPEAARIIAALRAESRAETAHSALTPASNPMNERVILRDSQTEADTTQIVAQYGEVAQACRRAQNVKHALTLIESLTGGGRRNAVERAAVEALCTLLDSCDFAVTAACVGLSEDQRQQAIRIAEHASTGAD
jgi:hypothetical protein